MLDVVADAVAEDVENHLPDDEDEDAKGNVSQGPSILKSVDNKDNLHDHIYQQADPVDKVQHHE